MAVIGETAGHYHVLERLGAGGMGEVYLAEDVRLQRPVALKVLSADAGRDQVARERLLREARLASALNHPGIAVIYEVGELEGEAGPVRYIAMEYVAGRSLSTLVDAGPIELDVAIDVVSQAAEALGEAHAQGIVHRDVKPSNVMLTDAGRVKVLDFGLAREHSPLSETASTWSRDRARLTGEGALLGTLAYMAPEQALGKEVDARADVFSLGALFYELLSGASPFARRDAVRVLAAVLHEPPPPLVARVADDRLPQVEAILSRMLAKEPQERYASMRDLLDDLAAVRRGERPVPAVPPAQGLAVMSFANITGAGEDEWLGTGLAETVVTDLRGVAGLEVASQERVRQALRGLGPSAPGSEEGVARRLGRLVGARFVLLGGFQRSGQAIRVTARLVEAESGAIAHTLKVDGRVDAIFELQDRLARELASLLRVRREPTDRAGDDTAMVEAYEAFAKGVMNMQMESYEALDRGVVFFEHAARLDPAYARAHLELGSAYSTKADYLGMPELQEHALAAFRRALELRPGLARAWREMGGTLVSLGREEEGLQAIRHALELAPDDPGALGTMARTLFIGFGRFAEAVDYYRRALALNPQGGWWALQQAHCLTLLRELPAAESMARRAVELQEASLSGREGIRIVGAYMRLGHVHAASGRPAEAMEQYRCELAFLQRVDHALRSRISIELHLRLGAAALRLERRTEAAAALDLARDAFEHRLRLGGDDPFTRYYAACVYALRGEPEPALACLRKAVERRRAFNVARARIEPELDGVREDPRFRELLA